ncbi:Histone-lysine N-methyltransferase SETMAR [Habropoda laboriosa]|uniref:Histone-lysine N-methyltransferase SETMAR n=1 Tax=Habropoda laboriosa TaxID=597456 RepID=A0A0L7R0Z4_9HYME|nr:Histone-lysine N-methyltransferase SETMAR [Habropoda laboriosa]
MHKKLQRLNSTLANCKGPILLHDNAQPHIAQRTGHESLPHPVYSLDLSLFETPRPLFVREDLHQPSCC